MTLRRDTKDWNSDELLHATWRGMKNRCKSPTHPSFKYYGGRGIKVCRRWIKSFEMFKKDMGQKPSRFHSIDRIDNDGNYCPGNCRWATAKRQIMNRRESIRLFKTSRKPTHRDIIRDEILSLMGAKKITVAEMVNGTGLARNGVYDYLGGKRSMHTGNASLMLQFARKKRGKRRK